MRRTAGTCALLSLLMALPLLASAQPPPPSPPGIRYALGGDTAQINSLALSADGLSFASASSDSTVKVWRMSDGALLRTFVAGYPDKALSVALSPDGTAVAAGDNYNNILMWSLVDDSLVHLFTTATVGGVLSLSYSSDGSTLAASGTGNAIYLYNTSDGSLQNTLSLPSTVQVNQVAFSPVAGQANLLASVSQDLTVRLWNTKTGATSSTPLTAFASQANCLAFSRDGTQLAVGGLDSTTNDSARVWSVVNGSIGSMTANIIANGTNPVGAIAFSQGGTLLATGTGGLVNTFTISSQAQVSSFNIGYTFAGLAFSNDGSTVTSASSSPNYGIIFQSSVSTGTLTRAVTQFQQDVTYLAFSSDSSRMAMSFGTPGSTQFRSVATGAVLPIYGPDYAHPFAFSPDGTLFAQMLETNPGNLNPAIFNLTNGAPPLTRGVASAYIWISADDQKVYTLSDSSFGTPGITLRTWRMADDVLLSTNLLFSGSGLFLTISNDQKRIVCTAGYGISVFSVPDGAAIQSFAAGGINSNVSLSGDGSYLAFGENDAYIYRVSDGMLMLDQPGSFGVVSVAISPFGDSVAAYRADGSITITAIDGTPVDYWNDQLGTGITWMQYTPDASSIVLCRSDGTVLVCYNPAPAALSALTLKQTTVDGGANVQGTVSINLPAPVGGVPIQISSSNPAVASVPSSALIHQNATSAIFSVQTSPVATPTVVTVSATLNGVTRNVNLTLNPVVAARALAFAPTTVQGGIEAVGIVTLLHPAIGNGQVVTLSSANPVVGVPTSVTVPPGKTSAQFVAQTGPVTANTPVTVTATAGGVTAKATLTVVPATVAALSMLPNSVVGGVENAFGIVTLSAAATTDVTVTLSVTTPKTAGDVTFPTSIVIPAGSVNGTFEVDTNPPTTAKDVVTFKAQIGTGPSKTSNLTVIP